ncbi:MAG: S-layer homology domain-containing protein, partial [Selenomonadaceae bacterium]|nr:S-layer homology domain-containing protein [Selenomonadaceae bacterium]
MKKKTLVSAVLAATIMGTTSVSLAAENMFSDVPLDHWAYDAIAKLAEDGIIEGYGDTGFGGDKAITRYEMAQLVAKAQANQENARAVDKAAIEKLQQEFDSELKGEVQNLRKDVDDLKSRMGWYADARVRYMGNKGQLGTDKPNRHANPDGSKNQFEHRLRLGFLASPDKNLTVDGRLKVENESWKHDGWGSSRGDNSDNHKAVELDKLSLNWENAGTNLAV